MGLQNFFKFLFGKKKKKELENQILELQNRLKQQQETCAALEKLYKEQEREYQQKIEGLEREAEVLKRKAGESEGRTANAEKRAESLEKLLTETEAEKKHAEEAAQSAAQKIADLQENYRKMQEECKKIETQYKEASEQNTRLSRQNQELNAKNKELSGQNTELTEQSKKLGEQSEQYKKETGKIPPLQAQVKDLQEKNTQLARALEGLKQKAGIGTIIEATITETVTKNGITVGYRLDCNGKEIYVASLDPHEKLSGKVRCMIMELQSTGYIIDNDGMLAKGKTVYIRANRRDIWNRLLYAGCPNGILQIKNTENEKKFEGNVEIVSKTTRKIGGIVMDVYTGVPGKQQSQLQRGKRR